MFRVGLEVLTFSQNLALFGTCASFAHKAGFSALGNFGFRIPGFPTNLVKLLESMSQNLGIFGNFT